MGNRTAIRERSAREVTLAAMQDQVRAYYQENLTDEEIAKKLGVHRTGVTKIRNDLGLPPRWGRRNGFRFTDEIDTNLMDLKTNTRLSWAMIAFLLDDMPVPIVCARYQLLLTKAPRHCETTKPEKIRCFQCQAYFITPNRRQIHYCDACHKRINQFGSTYFDL